MQQLKNSQDIKQNITKQLKDFMEKANLIPKSYNIIETIFDSHFKFDNKNEIFTNLGQHIFQAFNHDPSALIAYLQINEIISLKEIGLDKNKYLQLYNAIEKLKYKYGFFIKGLSSASQAPFTISSVGYTIANGGTLHNLQFNRADGITLSAMFNSETLMIITTSMIDALQKSMKDGVYTINDLVVKNYIDTNDNFKEFINALIDKSKSNTSQETAVVIGR